MDYYLDLRIQQDPEFPETMLLGALVSKLHRGLVTLDSRDIGISFPEHTQRLGGVLRIHSTEERIHELQAVEWLKGMRDHVRVGSITRIPDGISHCVVRRRQFKTNPERLRRRRMARHGETYEQAYYRIPDKTGAPIQTPHIVVRSASTGQAFSLFIEHQAPQPEAVEGTFTTYGLSHGATVPWF